MKCSSNAQQTVPSDANALWHLRGLTQALGHKREGVVMTNMQKSVWAVGGAVAAILAFIINVGSLRHNYEQVKCAFTGPSIPNGGMTNTTAESCQAKCVNSFRCSAWSFKSLPSHEDDQTCWTFASDHGSCTTDETMSSGYVGWKWAQ